MKTLRNPLALAGGCSTAGFSLAKGNISRLGSSLPVSPGECTSTVRSGSLSTHRRRKNLWRCGRCEFSPYFEQRQTSRRTRRRMITVRVAGGGWALPSLEYQMYQFREHALLTGDGPSCIFVGPIEKAEKARLEALYQQARDSYYNGSPLVLDDMFDRVEARLKWHGSKLVLKYPRCSLKRYSAYADAELDSAQMRSLATVWSVLLVTGIVAAAFPTACTIDQSCRRAIHRFLEPRDSTLLAKSVLAMNGALAIGFGLVIGIPVAIAAARSLQGLWRGDLVALKGCCPNCGEEVYAFLQADLRSQSQHRTDCHVCEHPLDFQANVERSLEHPGKLWAYGRVYLLTRSKDLEPSTASDQAKGNERR